MAASSLPLSQGTPEWFLAVDIIIIGILLAGISLGVGMAFRSRRVWAWGMEELAQAIVNAAMLGVLLAWVASADAITSPWVRASELSCVGVNQSYSQSINMPLYFSRCALSEANSAIVPLVSSISQLSYKLGWLSGVTISANVVTAKPFSAFGDTASSYSAWADVFAGLLSAAALQLQFLELVAKSAFSFFLPAGLVLRMFFATRKIGGALMAGAIGFYIIYPIAYSSLISPQAAIGSLKDADSEVTSALNSLSAVPIVDLGKSNDVSDLIVKLSGGNLSSSATLPYSALAASRAALELELFVFPLLALAITAVAIRELYLVLSSEFNLNLFGMV